MHLFALTPRGGRRNYVFLVPDDTEATRRHVEARVDEVRRAVERGRQSPTTAGDFIVAWRRVSQTTSGRSGYEWLCLDGIDARALPEAANKTVRDWLEARLADLERIVTHHDWDQHEGLFEVISDLGVWQREARSRFAGFQAPASKAGSGVGLPRGGRRSRRVWLAALLMRLMVFVIIAACEALWPRWVKRLLPLSRPTQKNGSSRTPSDISDKHWRDFAAALLGPERLPKALEGLKRHLAQQLRQLYASDAIVDRSPDEMIEAILQAFEKDQGRSGEEPLPRLIRSKPPEELKRLFPGGRFDPMGLVNWSQEDENFWREMDPYHVNKLLKPVINRKQEWKIPPDVRNHFKGKEEEKWYPVFAKLDAFCERPPQSLKIDEQMRRRFYKEEDKDTLRKLRELLQDLAGKTPSGERKTARESVQVVVTEIDQNRQPGTDLYNLSRGFNPNERPETKSIVDAARAVLDLGEEWSKVLPPNGSGTESGAGRAPDL